MFVFQGTAILDRPVETSWKQDCTHAGHDLLEPLHHIMLVLISHACAETPPTSCGLYRMPVQRPRLLVVVYITCLCKDPAY